MPTKLRAVSAGDTPQAAPPLSVTQAASKGTRRDLLVAMRTRVATVVQDSQTPARDLAALTRRLLEIAKEIEAIDVRAAEEAAESGATPDEAWAAI